MISLIVCADKCWGIGKGGRELLSIPENTRFIRETTAGKVVIMGRKTLEAMPQGMPLPNRTTIVLSTDVNYRAKGAIVAHSLDEALKEAGKYGKDIYIMGGESVFRQLLRYCDEVHVTAVDYTYDADAHFPDLDKLPEWVLVSESDEQTLFDIVFYYRLYVRRKDYRA